MNETELLVRTLDLVEPLLAPQPAEHSLRTMYLTRIEDLEEALLGMIGLVQLLKARGELTTDPTKNHRFVTAMGLLK